MCVHIKAIGITVGVAGVFLLIVLTSVIIMFLICCLYCFTKKRKTKSTDTSSDHFTVNNYHRVVELEKDINDEDSV